MGEISLELEKAPRGGAGGTRSIIPTAGKYAKADVLKTAGISTSQAHRAEKVAEIPVKDDALPLAQARVVPEAFERTSQSAVESIGDGFKCRKLRYFGVGLTQAHEPLLALGIGFSARTYIG